MFEYDDRIVFEGGVTIEHDAGDRWRVDGATDHADTVTLRSLHGSERAKEASHLRDPNVDDPALRGSLELVELRRPLKALVENHGRFEPFG